MEIFKNIPSIKYEGAESKNPLAFKFYDKDSDFKRVTGIDDGE